ncbi:helix-turn-helix domain-containing protein [Reinekea blandensis]|uniref:Predicted transcriptional regulator n=1 Tax=Reinekea blandensis MED297 TaxID=314283 RepID=A4BEY3_9GAMM|nr:helix-turn-helix transcriptional regulator [Reinekea blandensis]EAR09318.1 Predicted transcriptional regulator [Reinekea sp. MED297] [Reinekea blandensis MED297]
MPVFTEQPYLSETETSDSGSTFADRLSELIGDASVSAFARRVGLSESLIRKYLKGSEPSLSRADQIARRANVSLEWLATGCGYMYRQAEVVDQPALALADELVGRTLQEVRLIPSPLQRMTLTVSVYQFLRTHKKSDGYLDHHSGRQFAEHTVASLLNVSDDQT